MENKLAVITLCDNEDEVASVMQVLEGVGKKGRKPRASSKPKEVDDFEDDDMDDDLDDFEDDAPDLPMPTPAELKKALTDCQAKLGRDTLTTIFNAHGAAKLKELKKDEWPAVYAEVNKLLSEDSSDDDDDLDMDDDLDDNSGPDPEEVKKAVQVFNKKRGPEKTKKLLGMFGLNTVRGIKNASAEQLAGLSAKVTALNAK